MKAVINIILAGAFSIIFVIKAQSQNNKPPIHMQAKGTFEVKILPVEGTVLEHGAGVGRMTIDKKWSGGFSGDSKGAMLTGITESTGSMAYVAIEKVDATLNGKSGSFYFMHNATMKKSEPASVVSNITVVTGSGTGELTGLSGSLIINIDSKGTHSYIFNYELQ